MFATASKKIPPLWLRKKNIPFPDALVPCPAKAHLKIAENFRNAEVTNSTCECSSGMNTLQTQQYWQTPLVKKFQVWLTLLIGHMIMYDLLSQCTFIVDLLFHTSVYRDRAWPWCSKIDIVYIHHWKRASKWAFRPIDYCHSWTQIFV